jgi:hypothetical protein
VRALVLSLCFNRSANGRVTYYITLTAGSLATTPTKDKAPHRLPPNINKELEKRKIGNRYYQNNISNDKKNIFEFIFNLISKLNFIKRFAQTFLSQTTHNEAGPLIIYRK